MSILLTHGFFLAEDSLEQQVNKPYPPLGLLYLSSYLKSKGFSVDVFDATFSLRSAFQAYIQERQPRIVGFYVNMQTRASVLDLMRRSKEIGAMVIVGGPEPVNYASNYLQAGASVVVRGEGEVTLEELIPHLLDKGPSDLAGIDGITWLDQNNMVVNRDRSKIKDLDELPLPDRAAIDINQYMTSWKSRHGRSSVSLITARGCPYTCRWCSHSVFGFSYRSRSPQCVADELQEIAQTYHPDQVWYADDVFTMNEKWLDTYADELEKRNLHLPFETISREDRLNENVVTSLARLGCYQLWIGAESGSQAVLDAMDRKTDVVRMREMTRLLQQHGIRVGTFIMFGYEGETWNDLNDTMRHLRLSRPDDVLTTVSYPIKGTRYFDDVSHKLIVSTAWAESSDRDYALVGRHTRMFYRFTEKWVAAMLGVERARLASDLPGLIRKGIRSVIYRIGMVVTWPMKIRA